MAYMRLTSRRSLAACAVLIGALALGALVVPRVHNFKIDGAYSDVAAGRYGTTDQLKAVNEIASYRNDHATRILLMIAESDGSSSNSAVFQETRQAILALHRRTDFEIADKLAHLIQPHTPLLVRQAAASEVLSRDCKGRCLEDVLHYLEREYAGALSHW